MSQNIVLRPPRLSFYKGRFSSEVVKLLELFGLYGCNIRRRFYCECRNNSLFCAVTYKSTPFYYDSLFLGCLVKFKRKKHQHRWEGRGGARRCGSAWENLENITFLSLVYRIKNKTEQ